MTELNLEELIEDDDTIGQVYQSASGRWEVSTEELVILREQGKTYVEISELTGIPKSTIMSRVNRSNIKNKDNYLTAEKIVALRELGKSFVDIANQTGVNKSTLQTRVSKYLNKPENRHLKDRYLANAKGAHRNSSAIRSTSTSESTLKIVNMKKSGMSDGEIATTMGMSKTAVSSRINYYNNKINQTQDEPKAPEETNEQPKLNLAQRIKVLFTGKVD